MFSRAVFAGVLIFSASCSKSGSGEVSAPVATSGSAAKGGPGTGFSADLAKEIESQGKGAGGAKAGSDTAGGDSAGKAASTDPSAKAGDASKAGDGSKTGDAAKTGDVAKAGDASKAGDMAKAGDAKAGDAKAGDAKPGDASKVADAPKAGDTAKTGGAAKAGDATRSGDATKIAAAAPKADAKAASAPESHGPVKVSADLAAIKLSLLPNWDRDIDEAGTFQYVVRIKGTQSTKTFTFHYGYDDPKAPADRDQYKKYLQDSKAMTDIRDRQRGAAWFLEGNDASGLPVFRYQVLYGGKRLICYGSLYKDADSNRLGDDRDQTVIQAKQICETLAL